MKELKHIRIFMSVLLCGVLMAGCVGASDMPDDTERDEVCTLLLTLAAEPAVPQQATRAGTWLDPFPSSEATALEQRVGNADIYLQVPDGRVISLVAELLDSSVGLYQYKLCVPITADYLDQQPNGFPVLRGKIVALCNMPEGAAMNPFSKTLNFDINTVNSTGLLPMWGVREIEGITLKPTQYVNAGRLFLLRALPKITFQLASDIADDYEIVSVAPQQSYPVYGSIMPTGGEEVKDTRELSVEGCFNESETPGVVPLSFRSSSSGEVWSYLPEHTCRLEAGMPEYFTVSMRQKSTKTLFKGRVYLCDYKDGKPDYSKAFARLVRNHDYRFRINLTPIEFLVSFEEWRFGGKFHLELI